MRKFSQLTWREHSLLDFSMIVAVKVRLSREEWRAPIDTAARRDQ
jgi:hypothetical protein